MGFDITFHPVDKQDLQHFLFDVIDNPSLSESRVSELTTDEEKQAIVRDIYGLFPEWLNEMENFDDSEYKRRETLAWKIRMFFGRYPHNYFEFGRTFGHAAASIAGFRHPYWYSRNASLSSLAQYAPMIRFMITPLPKLCKSALSKVTDVTGGFITYNYCGGGFFKPEKVRALEVYLQSLEARKGLEGESIISRVFNEDCLNALKEAIKYATENNLGLMEATDVVVPVADEFATDPNNLRAYFLKD